MLEFNGNKFAQTKQEFDLIAAHGYYRVNRSKRHPGRVSILFSTPAKEPIALIAPCGTTVTAYKFEGDGKNRYMYACTKTTEDFLDIADLKYSTLRDMGRAAIN